MIKALHWAHKKGWLEIKSGHRINAIPAFLLKMCSYNAAILFMVITYNLSATKPLMMMMVLHSCKFFRSYRFFGRRYFCFQIAE